jgi:hypothetical protein
MGVEDDRFSLGGLQAIGQATAIGEFPSAGEREFSPPSPGEQLDYVLVLDDAGKRYPPPGAANAP